MTYFTQLDKFPQHVLICSVLICVIARIHTGLITDNPRTLRVYNSNVSLIFIAGLCIWHFAFTKLANRELIVTGLGNKHAPFLLYLWPAMMIIYDLCNSSKRSDDDPEEMDSIDVSSETAVIVGLIWAITNICRHPDATRNIRAQRCFVVAILIGICILLPSPNLDSKSYSLKLVRTTKKASLIIVIGILTLGMGMCGSADTVLKTTV